MRRSGSAGVLLIVGLLLTACGDAPPPDSADVAPSDTTPTPPTTDFIADAAWSPDGSRLAVTWDRGAGARIYGLLAGTDSTPPEPGRGLPLSLGRAAWAAWAPDGLWMAYASRGDLYRMRPDGTFEEPLVSGPAAESHPAYSSDGSRLAFVVQEEGGLPVVWSASAGGSGAAPVQISLRGRFSAPVWHPEGELVVGAVTADGLGIHALDPSDGSTRRLAYGEEPALSPDGSRLFYARHDSIFSLPWSSAAGLAASPEEDLDAEPVEELVVTPGHTPAPAPDGVRLAFVEGNRPRSALYVLNMDTGERHRVSQPPAERR